MSIKQEFANGIVRGVATLWKCEELQDFTVEINGVHFGCHRFILAACSDFFRGLFRSGMQETDQKRVILKDISSETFEIIMESIYTGHWVLTKDNVTNVWKAAHQLQISFLMSECENFVMNTLSIENYAEYFYNANNLSSSIVLDRLRPFVLKNCNSFFQTNYFLELPMDVVLSLIKSQDLETKSEDDVIDAIFKWAEFQCNRKQISCVTGESNAHSCEKNTGKENGATDGDIPCSKKLKYSKRISTASDSVDQNVKNDSSSGESIEEQNVPNNYIAILLSHSRIYLASKRCLEMLIRHPLVTENKEARDIFIDALLFQVQESKSNGLLPSRAVHRNNSNVLDCIATVVSSGIVSALMVYSFATKKLYLIAAFQKFKEDKHFVFNNELYEMASYYTEGFPRNSTLPLGLNFYQLTNDMHFDVKFPLPLRSENVHVAVVDSFVYIFSSLEESVWKLDIKSREVLEKSRLPSQESIAYLMSHGHCILVFYAPANQGVGGTVVRCFDTLQNTWTETNYLEGKADGMTSFEDDHFSYLLQSNGNMWKVVTTRSNVIDFELVARLWRGELSLHGAVSYLDDLHIGIQTAHDLPDYRELMRSLAGVFNEIIYHVIASDVKTMFTHMSFNKKRVDGERFLFGFSDKVVTL